MNERIRELAEQAGIVFWEISGDVDWRQANRENLGKFAELIVKECAEAVKNSVWHLPRGYKAEDQAEFVKKHFGVEE